MANFFKKTVVSTYTGVPSVLCFDSATVVTHLVVDNVFDNEGLLQNRRGVCNFTLYGQLDLKRNHSG